MVRELTSLNEDIMRSAIALYKAFFKGQAPVGEIPVRTPAQTLTPGPQKRKKEGKGWGKGEEEHGSWTEVCTRVSTHIR